MKKNTAICALILSLMLLNGCAGQTSVNQAEYIGLDAAKALALEAAGVPESEASFTTQGLDKRNGTDYYAVDFTAGGQEYKYDIDAITGIIIDSQVLALDGADSLAAQNAEGQTIPADNGNLTSSQGVQGQGSGQSSASGTGITQEQAKEIALSHAGLTSDKVTFLKAKLDWEDGRQVYDVEFYTSDYKEYDYEIDASTGKVVSYDYDAESYSPPSGNSQTISEEKAKSIALGQVPGATASDIWEFKLDYDDGRLEYEGKIYYSGMEYEFTIDGYSGAIREWEAEPM